MVTHRAHFTSLVGEARSENRPVLQVLAVLVQALVAHGEFIVRAQVEREVDVPAENLRQLHDRLVLHPRGLRGVEQRRVDDAVRDGHARLDRPRADVGAEAVGRARDLELLGQRQIALERQQFAVAVREVQRFARHQSIDQCARATDGAQVGQIGKAQLELAENGVQRVVAPDDDFDTAEGFGQRGRLRRERGRRHRSHGGLGLRVAIVDRQRQAEQGAADKRRAEQGHSRTVLSLHCRVNVQGAASC